MLNESIINRVEKIILIYKTIMYVVSLTMERPMKFCIFVCFRWILRSERKSSSIMEIRCRAEMDIKVRWELNCRNKISLPPLSWIHVFFFFLSKTE